MVLGMKRDTIVIEAVWPLIVDQKSVPQFPSSLPVNESHFSHLVNRE